MSDTQHYKELFLESVFADGITTIRKWDGDSSPWTGSPPTMHGFCRIQELGGVRSGGRKPPQLVWKMHYRFLDDLIWGYCSLTPFCGIAFDLVHILTYEERDRIIARFIWHEPGDTDLVNAPRIIVSPTGRIICSVIELDLLLPDLNEPKHAGAIAQSLGFAAWPRLPMFEFQGETVRPTFDTAVLFRMLYRPCVPIGAGHGDLLPLLDAITSEAIDHAGRNRSFFDPDAYFPNRLRRAVD